MDACRQGIFLVYLTLLLIVCQFVVQKPYTTRADKSLHLRYRIIMTFDRFIFVIVPDETVDAVRSVQLL